MYITNLDFEHRFDVSNGQGRNSTVFVAWDPQLDTEIVIKQLNKLDFRNPDAYFNEARILNTASHPNVVPINYATYDHDYIYLGMPYYKKGSLETLINSRYLTVREIVKYGLEFLSGVHYIHTKGLLHLDVKPTNVLINDSDVAVLTDFGLTKYVDVNGFAEPDRTYGKHIPPEAFISNKADVLFDIYQSGLTLYRMCNGNQEFQRQWDSFIDKPSAIQQGNFPDRVKFLPHIPAQLRTVITTGLKVSGTERYSTVLDMINDLSKIDKGLDWSYNHSNRKHVWTREEDAKVKRISVVPNNGTWDVKGEQGSLGKLRAKNDWTSTGHQSESHAFKQVQRIITSN